MQKLIVLDFFHARRVSLLCLYGIASSICSLSGRCRTEIRFATCVDKQGKRYNIELDNIRDAFVEYAKKLCVEIGRPDLPIYAGPNRHKLTMTIYPQANHTMQVIGNSENQRVYLDYDAGSHRINGVETANIVMYKIR